jgi:hypothetical protein
MTKLIDVMNAIPSGLKNSLSFELAGISLKAYIINKATDVINAYLKIEPYYVMKKPSDPSRMTSAISYMLRGPMSFLNISTNIFKLIIINTIENVHAENVIIDDTEFDTKRLNTTIKDNGESNKIHFIVSFFSG